MTDFALDTNKNLTVTNNTFTLFDAQNELRQRALYELNTFYGTYFLNLTFGFPYRETFFNSGVSRDTINSIMQTQLLQITGITDIISFESVYEDNTQTYRVNAIVQTIYGQMAMNDITIGL